jgi:cytochrome P450/glutathione S-transferase
MVSIPVSPYCEMARWLLDRLAIPYDEEGHAPGFHRRAVRRYGGKDIVPVLDTSDAVLLDARQILNYYEARCPQPMRLFPADAQSGAEARQLFDHFYDTFGVAVRAWAYAYMLPSNREAVIRTWTTRVPALERMAVPLFYSHLVKLMQRSLGLKPDTVTEQRAVMESVFKEVEARLADGRRYLTGEQFTAADLALAALGAPAVLPPEYGGPLPELNDLPSDMRADVESIRARPAGQFILRVYREARPHAAIDPVTAGTHKPGDTFKDKLFIWVTKPGLLRAVFKLLRNWAPILFIGKTAILTRHADVIEVLERNTDFTIAEINEERINAIDGPFILGMDRSEQYDRESAALQAAVHREDLDRIRGYVRQSAEALTAAAQPQGRIDVVGGLARVVPVRLVESYFGITVPDEPTMMRWMRDIFQDLFVNPGADPLIHRDALNSVAELRQHMNAVIELRKSKLNEPDQPDDMLGRLLALQDAEHPWLDNNAVRRNLGGLIAGSVDTTSKFTTLAIDELLRRPQVLADARRAAMARDMDAMRRYTYEAVRFNPHHPVQARHCKQETEVAAGTKRARRIPAGYSVFIATLSAMFDPEVFTEPDEFRIDRDAEYLHFGYGMHRCFGSAMNGVQIPELVAALLRLPNLRRADGSAGRIVYDGPFPQQLILEFDRDGNAPGGKSI